MPDRHEPARGRGGLRRQTGEGRRQATTASAAVLLLAILAGCSQTGDGGDAPGTAAPPSPTPTFAPVFSTQTETITFDDPEVPVIADVEVPVISGVDPQHAERFAAMLRADVDEEFRGIVDVATSFLPAPPQFCSERTTEGCGIDVDYEQQVGQISGDYATVTYTNTFTIFGGVGNTSTSSVTMNMRTGQEAVLDDFIDTRDPALLAAIRGRGQCTDMLDPQVQPEGGFFDAFSPTDEGIRLAWDEGTYSANSCGAASVTLPWEEFGKPGAPTSQGAGEESGDGPSAGASAGSTSPAG